MWTERPHGLDVGWENRLSKGDSQAGTFGGMKGPFSKLEAIERAGGDEELALGM